MIRAFACAATLATATSLHAAPITVIAYGDAPYGDPAEVYPPFETLIETINARAPALAIHVGDTKSGGTPCSDEILADQLAFMNRVTAPVLYTPGDNEWTDCHRANAGEFDPLERLAHIRATYFDAPGTSFGANPIAIESQGGTTPENARVVLNNVMFVTAHVVGSNNGFEIHSQAAVGEFFDRDARNIAWLSESFDAAADNAALVLAIHANMFEFDFGPAWNREIWLRHSGFQRFGEVLKAEAAAFGKPVLLVYGDSHVFRQSRPFPASAPNLMALEVPGAQDMHAVEITVDPATSGVFSVAFVENPALAN